MRDQVPFSVEEASDSSGFLLWQVTALWQRRIAGVLRPHDLTQVQFALLASLLWLSRTEDRITQVMLARHTKLDVMMTSQVLRTLEKRGLIQRRPHPSDTRAKVLRVTRSGREKAMKAVPDVERADAEFFCAIGEDIRELNRALQTLIKAATDVR